MAETMQFDLVSPERRLASFEVRSVQIPGADGDMTAMPDHAPTITTLRPGLLTVDGPQGTSEFLVTGGFAEINSTGVTVLAEQALPKGDMTHDDLKAMVAEAEAALARAKEAMAEHPGAVDEAAKLLADMVAMGDHIRV